MQKMDHGSIAILRSAPEVPRRKYRQESNFYYLTGFDEPDSVCLIIPDHPEHKFVLFVRPKDRGAERLSGIRVGVEDAVEQYGADIAHAIDEFDERILAYLDKAEKIYCIFEVDPDFDEKILSLVKKYTEQIRLQYDRGPYALVGAREILHDMRLIKSEAELKILRQAVDITAEAHIAAMRAVRPGIYEYEIEALIDYIFRKNGALLSAFGTVVGSGPNSAIVHSRANSSLIEDGAIVLVDAGAEYRYYNGDVTRTIPANGKFSKEQQEVYEAVLTAQTAAIETIKPGEPFSAPYYKAMEGLTEGLVQLGILEGDVSQLVSERKYTKYTMGNRAAPHWLGMDDHDAGKYTLKDGTFTILQPNMVLTVEPGLYFPADMPEVPEKYRNIGVRIEDDILVTPDGRENLTAEIPKTSQDIEKTMKKKLILRF